MESKLGPLGTSATSGQLYLPRGGCDNGGFCGMKIGRGNRSTRKKPAPAPLCQPQIPLDQNLTAVAVGSQLLTVWAVWAFWAMARLNSVFVIEVHDNHLLAPDICEVNAEIQRHLFEPSKLTESPSMRQCLILFDIKLHVPSTVRFVNYHGVDSVLFPLHDTVSGPAHLRAEQNVNKPVGSSIFFIAAGFYNCFS
jgi:hypothetical protein